MDNIVYLTFSPTFKNFFLPTGEICEYFKVDFNKKKIKAYKMLNEESLLKASNIKITPMDIINKALLHLGENNIGQPN